MSSLYLEITAGPKAANIAPYLSSRDFETIANILNTGRVKANEKLVGVGLILDTLGIEVGNIFLDTFYANNIFRHAWKLMDSATLQVSLPIVQQTIDSFVPAILTQQQADSLKSLGFDPDPVTAAQCANAIDGGF